MVPIELEAHESRVRLFANVDTGASFCIFRPEYAEQLGIIVETGDHKKIDTATGSFDAYGHPLKLCVFDWTIDATVYFAMSEGFKRDVLGRSGWLQHFRVGIVDHDMELYMSHYDEVAEFA